VDIQQVIRTRHAVRTFSDRPVPEDVMRAILDAGRRSQSSKNTQPWHFIVIQDRNTLKAVSQLGDYASHVAGAAFAVALVGTAQTHWNSFDLGQAAAQLQLAAWGHGVGSCIAAMHNAEGAKELLGIPQDANFYAVLSFGYPAEEHTPARMGGRKPLADIVRWERW
jgi:nitroreductase